MGLNLKHAQYIMEIIKEGSITNASKTMHVSQPALSQTIKAVEKYLGAPIFLRNTKPIVLTVEVKTLMNSDVTGTESGLVCAWDFTTVVEDVTNIPDKTGKHVAKIVGNYKWFKVEN